MNHADYISVYSSISQNKRTFLVDTQADISVVKVDSIHRGVDLNESERITIRGITDDAIESFGTTEIDLLCDNYRVTHKFHVVSDDFNIASDGILGKDFIKTMRCNLNFENMTISFYINNQLVILPILQGPEQDIIVLPARCEVVRKIKLKNVSENQVIHSNEIEPGVFVSRSIVDPKNTYIKILNTTHDTKIITNLNLKHENLSNFTIYKADTVQNNTNRLNELTKIIKENTNISEDDKFIKICENYNDIFAVDGDRMTINNFYEQKLQVMDNQPVYVKNYRLPHTQKLEIDKQVNKLLENDLIEPSVSSFNSPVILVPKKSTDGTKKYRMCIDYRMVNKKLVTDKFPLPRIDEILDQLGRAKYFSILDLYSGFHQIPIEKNSREITSFSTTKGAFQWKVLPFGLNVAPNSFSRMMVLATQIH